MNIERPLSPVRNFEVLENVRNRNPGATTIEQQVATKMVERTLEAHDAHRAEDSHLQRMNGGNQEIRKIAGNWLKMRSHIDRTYNRESTRKLLGSDPLFDKMFEALDKAPPEVQDRLMAALDQHELIRSQLKDKISDEGFFFLALATKPELKESIHFMLQQLADEHGIAIQGEIHRETGFLRGDKAKTLGMDLVRQFDTNIATPGLLDTHLSAPMTKEQVGEKKGRLLIHVDVLSYPQGTNHELTAMLANKTSYNGGQRMMLDTGNPTAGHTGASYSISTGEGMQAHATAGLTRALVTSKLEDTDAAVMEFIDPKTGKPDEELGESIAYHMTAFATDIAGPQAIIRYDQSKFFASGEMKAKGGTREQVEARSAGDVVQRYKNSLLEGMFRGVPRDQAMMSPEMQQLEKILDRAGYAYWKENRLSEGIASSDAGRAHLLDHCTLGTLIDYVYRDTVSTVASTFPKGTEAQKRAAAELEIKKYLQKPGNEPTKTRYQSYAVSDMVSMYNPRLKAFDLNTVITFYNEAHKDVDEVGMRNTSWTHRLVNVIQPPEIDRKTKKELRDQSLDDPIKETPKVGMVCTAIEMYSVLGGLIDKGVKAGRVKLDPATKEIVETPENLEALLSEIPDSLKELDPNALGPRRMHGALIDSGICRTIGVLYRDTIKTIPAFDKPRRAGTDTSTTAPGPTGSDALGVALLTTDTPYDILSPGTASPVVPDFMESSFSSTAGRPLPSHPELDELTDALKIGEPLDGTTSRVGAPAQTGLTFDTTPSTAASTTPEVNTITPRQSRLALLGITNGSLRERLSLRGMRRSTSDNSTPGTVTSANSPGSPLSQSRRFSSRFSLSHLAGTSSRGGMPSSSTETTTPSQSRGQNDSGDDGTPT